MSRLLGTLLFVGVVFIVSDCQAQRHRGLFRRAFRAQPDANFSEMGQTRMDQDSEAPISQPEKFGFQAVEPAAPSRRHFFALRPYSTQAELHAEQAEAFPKYYGGFHSSHFTDVGLPTGDQGFRGNGIYWAPW